MKTITGVICAVFFAATTVLGLTQPRGGGVAFVGLVGLVLTVVVVWRERFPHALSYVLITLGILRALFPVTTCVPYGYGLGAVRALGHTAYLPWECDVQVQPVAGITAVQAIVLIGVGAWWLWWQRVGNKSPSGLASLGGPLVSTPSTPSIDRAISADEARLADIGSRRLFNKPLSALIEDFDRIGEGFPVALLDLLIAVGKRLSGA